MDDNIFIISDASYSSKTKVAGLGVIDLYSGIKHSMNRINMKNSFESEYYALLLSVQIAIKNKYNNVVFVYDCQGLHLDKLKEYLKNKIKNFQFLWLKRSFTDEADSIARLARELEEKLIATSRKQKKKVSNQYDFKKAQKKIISDKKVSNAKLLKIFKGVDEKNIIYSCMCIATVKEKKVLIHYLNGTKEMPLELATRIDKISLYNFVYNMIPENKRKKFYHFIENIILGKFDKGKIVQIKPREIYIEMIQRVLDELKRDKTKRDRDAS